MIHRRQMLGVVMVLAAAVLWVVGMATRLRFVAYTAYVLVAAGLWLATRRSEE